jgi:acetyltransferase EpsM
MRPLKIIGCGGHGRVIADIARATGEPSVDFLDDNPASAPANLRVEGPTLSLLPQLAATHRFVIGIGDAKSRRRMAEDVVSVGGELAVLVHPSSVIAPDVTLGEGTVVMAGSIINTGTRVGRLVVINTGAIVDHDNLIEDNVQIAPGARLAGNVTCRSDAFVGTGAIVIPRIEIGEGAYVAAGAVVIRPVRARTLVAGCPAFEKKVL